MFWRLLLGFNAMLTFDYADETGDFAEDAGPDVMEAVAHNCANLDFIDELVHPKVHAQTCSP